MRGFSWGVLRFVALSVFVLIVILVIVAEKNSWIDLNFSAKNKDTTETTETDTRQTEIVRTGVVGTPVLLPISSGFAGSITELYVKEGQHVKAGQPLFKQEVMQSSGIPSKTAALSENALKEYDRLKKLYEQGAISRRELEGAASRLNALQKKSSSEEHSAAGSSDGAASSIKTSPVEGVVTGLAVEAGVMVQADQQVMSLGNGQPLEVVVPLEQNELYWVQPGTPASVEAAGFRIVGEVSSIFPEIKGDSISAFQAHISLVSFPATSLHVGMTVSVRMVASP